MSGTSDVSGPHQELKEIISSGQLSAPLQKQAESILGRIERPVRLGVMGLAGSGKSTLLNLLLGTEVLPVGLQMPSVNLSFGPKRTAICTLGNGSKETINFESLSDVLELNPVFVDATLPLPALQKLSMMEVVAGANPAELKPAIAWATKRIDIALWCSAGDFSTQEENIWKHTPERIQDHAFLLLTKTDMREAVLDLDQRIADAQDAGEDFFKEVLAIGTKSAIAAKNSDGSVDKAALKRSGGMALISAILRDVEAGRRHAIDQAHVFLHQVDFTAVKPKPAETVADPVEDVIEEPINETILEPIDDDLSDAVVEAPAEEVVEEIVEAPAEENAAPEPEDTKPEIAEPIALEAASRPAIEQAVAQLAEEGRLMMEDIAGGALDDAGIVDNCVDTVTWLADYLADSGDPSDPVYAQSCNAAVDAADLVQLIRLEPGDSVASDSLSVLLQLKQDMQMRLAA